MAYALLSVYNKQSIIDFARVLSEAGYDLISTGATFETVSSAGGLDIQQVADVTGSPEILDGRVKTLHPKIHGGILARRDQESHTAEMEEQGITPIDVVVSNLYPFVETISKPDVTQEEALENIDIGGPAMVRAAAKNFPDVIVIVDPADYGPIGDMIKSGRVPLEERRRLAAKAFQHVAVYDSVVASYLRERPSETGRFPVEFSGGWNLVSSLKYGENPHQPGALYATPGTPAGIAGARQLLGPELGYVNYLDADSAWRSVSGLPGTAVSIVKHALPCGLAQNDDQAEAYRLALAGDPISAYGGTVGFNTPVSAATADAMKGVLFHVLVAPSYEPEALEILSKRKSVRILQIDKSADRVLQVRSISGGVLVQAQDPVNDDPDDWEVKTDSAPTPDELRDLKFALYACAMIKSNAIVMAKNQAIVGMGAGQPNRVMSVEIAARVAGEESHGSVLASDAFFPFSDSIEAAQAAGCTAIIAPGGSIRDDEVVAEANKRGITLVFTPNRHFLH